MKACADCRWFGRNIFMPDHLQRCYSPLQSPDLLSGKKEAFARNMRSGLVKDQCGLDGRWFEPQIKVSKEPAAAVWIGVGVIAVIVGIRARTGR